MAEEQENPQKDLESSADIAKSVGSNTPRIVEWTGTTVEYTGKTVQAAGKGVQVAGRGISALAAIPYIGAVFGAIGGGVQAAGSGVQAAGKGIGTAGKRMKSVGKLGKSIGGITKIVIPGKGASMLLKASGGPIGLASLALPLINKAKDIAKKIGLGIGALIAYLLTKFALQVAGALAGLAFGLVTGSPLLLLGPPGWLAYAGWTAYWTMQGWNNPVQMIHLATHPWEPLQNAWGYAKGSFDTITAGPVTFSGGVFGGIADAVSSGVRIVAGIANNIGIGVTNVATGTLGAITGASNFAVGGLSAAASTVANTAALGAVTAGTVATVGTVGVLTQINTATGFFSARTDSVIPGAVGNQQPPPSSAGCSMFMVGDSIMLGVSDELRALGDVEVDAETARQFSEGVDIITARKNAGTLKDTIVIELGTNGQITEQLFDQMMAQLDGVSRVIFINNRVPKPWEGPNNDLLRSKTNQFGNAILVDWYQASNTQSGYFQPDGTHLTAAGETAYVDLLSQNLPKCDKDCPSGWPFASNQSSYVSQGPEGASDHGPLGFEALDLPVPLGTPVYSTFEGDVGNVLDVFPLDSRIPVIPSTPCASLEVVWFYHLQTVSVRNGDHVTRGQLVGYSGTYNGPLCATVQCGPHLHYQFNEAKNRDFRMEIPNIPENLSARNCEEGSLDCGITIP